MLPPEEKPVKEIMRYPANETIIDALKEWFGWDDDVIALIKKANGLRLLYKIMIKEKSDDTANRNQDNPNDQ